MGGVFAASSLIALVVVVVVVGTLGLLFSCLKVPVIFSENWRQPM